MFLRSLGQCLFDCTNHKQRSKRVKKEWINCVFVCPSLWESIGAPHLTIFLPTVVSEPRKRGTWFLNLNFVGLRVTSQKYVICSLWGCNDNNDAPHQCLEWSPLCPALCLDSPARHVLDNVHIQKTFHRVLAWKEISRSGWRWSFRRESIIISISLQ